MKLAKLIPVLIMVAGLAAGGIFGKDLVVRILTRVKVLITGLEVRNIGEELRFYYLSTGELPGDEADEFGQFLRQNFKPYWGSRDAAKDLFDNPFLMVRSDTEQVVYSTGPNGQEDECLLLDGDKLPEVEATEGGDDICVSLETALRDTPFRPLAR